MFDQSVARDSDATTDLLLASFLAFTFARRSAFGGSLFPPTLRMNAEIAPRRLRKLDVIVFRSLLDVGEGQSTIGIGNADDLIEPRDGIANVLSIGQPSGSLRWLGKA